MNWKRTRLWLSVLCWIGMSVAYGVMQYNIEYDIINKTKVLLTMIYCGITGLYLRYS